MVHDLTMIQHVRDPTIFHNILNLCLCPDEGSLINVRVKGHFTTSVHSCNTSDINLPVRVESHVYLQGFQRVIKCSSCYHRWGQSLQWLQF